MRADPVRARRLLARWLRGAGDEKPEAALELTLGDDYPDASPAVRLGGASSLIKLNPPMRNPNEKRRVDAALSKNMEAQRQRRAAAAAGK